MASWIEKINFKFHGAKNWPYADATVFDFSIIPGAKNTQYGSLSYSFWHKEHIYSGIASWDCTGNADSRMYSKDETIQVRFNPLDPNESYFPDQEDPDSSFNLLLVAIALIPVGLLIWYGCSRMNR